jgi:hypothetical protein
MSPRRQTRFAFTCSFCGHDNEYVHRHRPAVHPYLVSMKCSECHQTNHPGAAIERVTEDAPEERPADAASA